MFILEMTVYAYFSVYASPHILMSVYESTCAPRSRWDDRWCIASVSGPSFARDSVSTVRSLTRRTSTLSRTQRHAPVAVVFATAPARPPASFRCRDHPPSWALSPPALRPSHCRSTLVQWPVARD